MVERARAHAAQLIRLGLTVAGMAMIVALASHAPPAAAAESLAAAPGMAAAPPATPTDPKASSAKPLGAEPVLRHLPNNIQGFRVSGEIGASEWPLYLSEAQAHTRLKFRVGYLSAISVMPEASKLTVSINDVVDRRDAGHGGEFGADNRIRSAAGTRQAGLQRGPDLGRSAPSGRVLADTRPSSSGPRSIPAETGLVLPASVAGPSDPSELGALPPDGQGALPVRAVMMDKVRPADVERAMLAVQMIAAGGHFEQPSVDVGPPAGGEYGVNLLVGRFADIKDVAGVGRLGLVAGPRVAVLPATDQLRATIVITGETDDDVNKALAQFGAATPMRGAVAGVRAARAFPGYRVNAGETVHLADLGLRSQEFSGHYFRTAFNIVLPADFYSADYAKVPLDLAGGYGAGLLSSAQVVVAINGRNAVTAPLPRSGGDVFKEMVLPLPLGDLRPGLNRIEIFAQLPMASDANCDPLAVINAKKRFLFLDSTSIQIPSLARIGRVPDLAVTATGGFPFVGGQSRPILFAPSPDRDAIGAAATIVARIAASSGTPIDFQFTTVAPPIGSGATLMVAPASRLDDATLTAFAIDPERLRKSWSDRFPLEVDADRSQPDGGRLRARNRLVLQKNLPAACRLKWRVDAKSDAKPENKTDHMTTGAIALRAAPSGAEAPSIVNSDAQSDLFDEWSQQLSSQSAIRRWTSNAIDSVSGVWGDLAGRARKGADQFAITPQSPGDPIENRDNLFLFAQAALGPGVDSVWTLATAPNSRLLAQSAECLSDPRVWAQVHGQMAALDGYEGRITAVEPATMSFVSTQPFSPTNLRLVAASWLSLNRFVYVALTVLVGFMLAFCTLRFVRSVGRSEV